MIRSAYLFAQLVHNTICRTLLKLGFSECTHDSHNKDIHSYDKNSVAKRGFSFSQTAA
jgi:hypothetical protein